MAPNSIRHSRLGGQASSAFRNRHAFTLIELIAAVSVTAVIGSLAASMLIEASRVRGGAAVRAELTESAARAMEQSLRYLREIEQDTGLTGKAQVTQATDLAVDFGTNGIRRNGADLELSIDGGATWHALVRDVSALTFRYYAADGTELIPVPLSGSQREAIRQVSMELQLERGSESVRLRSRVYLRNFSNEAS